MESLFVYFFIDIIIDPANYLFFYVNTIFRLLLYSGGIARMFIWSFLLVDFQVKTCFVHNRNTCFGYSFSFDAS